MAEDNNIDIAVGVRSEKAEKGLSRVEGSLTALDSTGKKTTGHLVAYFQNVRSAIQKVQAVMSTVSFFTMWINATGDLINKFKEWRRHAQEVREEHERLVRAVTAKKLEEAVAADVEAYRKLVQAISEAESAANRLNSLADRRTGMLRNIENEQINADEARALAAVSDDDPDAEAKRTKIRNGFAVRRAEIRAGRAEEDARKAHGRLYDSAAQKDADAQTLEDQNEKFRNGELAGAISAEGDARKRLEAAKAGTMTTRTVFTGVNGQFGTATGTRTETVRTVDPKAVEKAQQEYDAALATMNKLQDQYDARAKQIAGMRKDANGLREEAGIASLGGVAEKSALEAARITASRSDATADRSVEKRRAEEEERARKLADERASLVAQQGQLRTQMTEAQRARGLALDQLGGAWASYDQNSGSTPAEMQRRYNAASRAESAAEKALKQADSTIEKTARQMELVSEKLSKLNAAMSRQNVKNDET